MSKRGGATMNRRNERKTRDRGTSASRTPRTLVLALLAAFATGALAQEDPVRLLIDQGKYWQARGRADRAAEAWQKILRLNPSQPDALYGMGVSELDAGRVDSARGYLERLSRAQPNGTLARQLSQSIARGGSANTRQQVEQARELARSGQSDEAVRRYEQAAGGAAPQGDLALEYYQTLGGTTQGWDAARRGLEELARANPSDARAQLALAQHLTYREATRRDGIRQLEALSRRTDVGTQASDSWRRALNWLGSRPADLPFYQSWLAAHPDDAQIRARAETANSAARQQAAVPAAAAADPLRAVIQQGFAALDRNELDLAASRFQEVLAKRPNDADALGGMGVLRLKQEKFAEALDFLDQASRRGAGNRYRRAQDSASYWLLLDQANAARENGNVAEARRLLDRAIKLDANEPTAQVALADLTAQAGQYAQAEAAYRRVLRLQADNPDAVRGLVSVLAAQNKSTEALALVEQMTPAQRDKVGSLGRLRADQARAQARQAQLSGDAAGARRALEDAMAADPTNPWVRLDVARNYVAMGMNDKARSVMDTLLDSGSPTSETLYASALLASETKEWQRGLGLLERIPAQQRTRDMGALQRRLWVNAETERATGLVAAGQQAAALDVLQQAERYAQQDPDLAGTLALAYAEAGDEQRALTMMRTQLSRTVRPDAGTQLQYAAILLKTGQDVELAGLLRQLAAVDLTPAQRKDYDELRIAYIVRQADALTEAGDLVGAYDMLAPALSERGGSSAVRASLARMYAQAGENKQALMLYESVLSKDPRNLDLRLAAIGTATAAKEYQWAENALKPALAQAPNSPQVLTTAGNLYRAQGKNARAEQFFRAAVAAENGVPGAAGANALAGANRAPGAAFDRVPPNPFVGLPGQRQASQLPGPGSRAPYPQVPGVPVAQGQVPGQAAQARAMAPRGMPGAGQPYIPAPVGADPAQTMAAASPAAYMPAQYPSAVAAPAAAGASSRGRLAAGTGRSSAAGAMPPPASPAGGVPRGAPAQNTYAQNAYAAPTAYADPQSYAAAEPARQPYGAQSRLPWLADNDTQSDPTRPKTALESLREIEQERTRSIAGGPMLRARDGDSGMSQLTEMQMVAEAKMPVGDGKLIARVTPVALEAGSVGSGFSDGSRFGGGPIAWATPPGTTNVFGAQLRSASAGSQSAFGVAMGVAYESDRFSADVGTTPLGFRYTDVNAGARLNLPMSQRTTLGLSGSRRPVTDSLLSYAGVRDDRVGLEWGGVMATGGRADFGWDDGSFGLYAYGGYSVLTGHDVKRNTKWEGGGGFYMRLVDTDSQRMTSGINFTSMGYGENLRYFTFGHGGYFSPQTYYAVTVPLTLSGRTGRLAYQVRGALGVQAFQEDAADYFPTNPGAQAAADAAVRTANSNNLTNATSATYADQSKTGLAYNLVGSVEYQAAQQLFVGGLLGLDNARDYRQWYAGVYVRYSLQRQTGQLMFPPVAPQSAVGPLPF